MNGNNINEEDMVFFKAGFSYCTVLVHNVMSFLYSNDISVIYEIFPNAYITDDKNILISEILQSHYFIQIIDMVQQYKHEHGLPENYICQGVEPIHDLKEFMEKFAELIEAIVDNGHSDFEYRG